MTRVCTLGELAEGEVDATLGTDVREDAKKEIVGATTRGGHPANGFPHRFSHPIRVRDVA